MTICDRVKTGIGLAAIATLLSIDIGLSHHVISNVEQRVNAADIQIKHRTPLTEYTIAGFYDGQPQLQKILVK